ncbi:hypothetical protein ABVK25_007929 [Lepraria finkii]|uniref:NmrA-like domain-containing protein n=1 Tax=Lepraria finkii TaxID=1340010 RepID=A0ABR4B7J3_9LECA
MHFFRCQHRVLCPRRERECAWDAHSAGCSLIFSRSTVLSRPATNGAKKVAKIICLSSASLNPRIGANEPRLLLWVVQTAFSYTYADLALAEAYLRLHKSWLDVTFMTPGVLVEDEQKGHVLTMDNVKAFLSYPDLAAGMIEVAESGSYDWKQVGVSPTGKNVKIEWKAPKQMAKGLVFHFTPWLGRMAQYVGLF